MHHPFLSPPEQCYSLCLASVLDLPLRTVLLSPKSINDIRCVHINYTYTPNRVNTKYKTTS